MNAIEKKKKRRDHHEQWARKNREKFLAPFKEQYDKLRGEFAGVHENYIKAALGRDPDSEALYVKMEKIEKQIAEIIIDLIKTEPSNLAEPWILWTVISWIDRFDRVDFLNAAFIEQKGRARETDEQVKRRYVDDIIKIGLKKIQAENKCGIAGACRKLAELQANEDTKIDILPQWDEADGDQSLEVNLRKRFYKRRPAPHNKSESKTPIPYWGKSPRPKEYPSPQLPRKVF